MKGYYTPYGYRGYLPSQGKYLLFSCERDYIEYYNEYERGNGNE